MAAITLRFSSPVHQKAFSKVSRPQVSEPDIQRAVEETRSGIVRYKPSLQGLPVLALHVLVTMLPSKQLRQLHLLKEFEEGKARHNETWS